MQNETSPLVSIIMPTYNRANYIEKAIKSVLNQTYFNWELIIWDDGSTDQTEEYINSLHDDHILYIKRQQNKGIGFSRKQAIEIASGDLIALLDSDDEWFDNKLKIQLDFLEKNPEIDFVFSNFINVNELNETRANGFAQTEKGLDCIEKKFLGNYGYEIISGLPQALLKANFIATSSVIFRKPIIKKAGNFNPELSGPEDLEFWWRLALSGTIFGYIEIPLIIRNKNESSISGVPIIFVKKYINALEVIRDITIQSSRNDLIDPIDNSIHKSWINLIFQYGKINDKKNSWKAFIQASKKKFTFPAIGYLIISLIGIGPNSLLVIVRKKIKKKP